MTLRLGYGYLQSQHERIGQRSQPYGFHNIIASVDYDRGFSLNMTKQTQFTFGFGSTVGQETRLDASGAQQQSVPRIYLTGNAELSHDMGRTWTTAIAYSRALRIVDGFGEPQLVDSVVATLGGLVTRRLDLSSFARYGTGLPVSGQSQRFQQTQATVQVRLALNRYLSLFSQVFFSHFDSAFALTLNPGVPQALSRYGARAGINLWSPLLNTRGAS